MHVKYKSKDRWTLDKRKFGKRKEKKRIDIKLIHIWLDLELYIAALMHWWLDQHLLSDGLTMWLTWFTLKCFLLGSGFVCAHELWTQSFQARPFELQDIQDYQIQLLWQFFLIVLSSTNHSILAQIYTFKTRRPNGVQFVSKPYSSNIE